MQCGLKGLFKSIADWCSLLQPSTVKVLIGLLDVKHNFIKLKPPITPCSNMLGNCCNSVVAATLIVLTGAALGPV